MPDLKFVNTEAMKSPNRAEENLKTFFSNISQEYGEKQSKAILDPIWEQYGQNEDNKNRYRQASTALQKSNLSPSKRIAAQQQLNEFEKLNTETEKSLNSKVANTGKEYGKIREKSVGKYVSDSMESAEAAQDQKFAIDEARNAVKGEVQGPGFKALLKSNPYSQMLFGLTPDEATLQAANKQLVSGSKGLFGSKPTEREIFLLLNSMLPSVGKTKEANQAGLDFIEKVNEMKILRSDLVNQLTDGGANYVPNLESLVNEQMKPATEQLLKELREANELYNGESGDKKGKSKELQVKAPDGSLWNMTQEQIDDAKKKGVVFEPVKK